MRTIIDDPMSGKTLTHELQGLRSFRVGRIRVIYSVVSMTLIEIVSIGPRKSIYEETYKIISRENRFTPYRLIGLYFSRVGSALPNRLVRSTR